MYIRVTQINGTVNKMNKKEALAQLQVGIDQLSSAVDDLETNKCPASDQAAASGCPVFHCAACATPDPGCVGGHFVPDYNIPELAPGGGDHDPAILKELGPLAGLIGTWVSDRQSGFNVMPIPQATAPNGFILKNVAYYEVTTFSAISGKVANRGGKFEQDCYTIFYEQRVFFADGPQANQLVHAENGSWLHLVTGPQGQGPLNTKPDIPSPPAPDPIPPQDPTTAIVKQVSVPHGNSILATGFAKQIDGAPDIPDVNTLPQDVPKGYLAPYGTDIPTNPNVNPNIVLKQALANLPDGVTVTSTQILDVDSENNGEVVNIPFIEKFADVSRFTTTFWLETLSNGQPLLQYSQNISLKLALGNKKFLFPHVTANTLYKIR